MKPLSKFSQHMNETKYCIRFTTFYNGAINKLSCFTDAKFCITEQKFYITITKCCHCYHHLYYYAISMSVLQHCEFTFFLMMTRMPRARVQSLLLPLFPPL